MQAYCCFLFLLVVTVWRTEQHRNAKNIVNDTRMDSMVFEPSTRTIHYYYSLVGNADNEQAINSKKSELRKALNDALKADAGTKGYKDAGFNFRYTYRSGKTPSKVLLDEQYTEKDY